jgi:hypothetical protein
MTTSTTYTYTAPVTGMASNGQVLISNGTPNINWGTTTSTSPWVTGYESNLKPSSLSVQGEANFESNANFKGDVKIQGQSIVELINNIEKRLAILHPNEKLEEKWEKLKKLGDEYREMEKELLHSEEMWKILKK